MHPPLRLLVGDAAVSANDHAACVDRLVVRIADHPPRILPGMVRVQLHVSAGNKALYAASVTLAAGNGSLSVHGPRNTQA